MPATPWTALRTPKPGADCTILASKLPLRSDNDLPALLEWADLVEAQLRAAHGLLGYAIRPDASHPTLWTVSAWASRRDLADFDRHLPHATAKHVLRETLRPSTLLLWTGRTENLPIGWDEVHARLDAADGWPPDPTQPAVP